MSTHLLAIDVETGGFQVGRHALLSIAAAPSWGQAPFHELIVPCPGLEVELEAARINGYTDKGWKERGAVTLDVAFIKLGAWLEGRPKEVRKVEVLAHNAGYDRAWLDWGSGWSGIEVKGLDHRWRCSMAALAFCQDAGLLPAGKCTLDALCALAGVERPAVHDALVDAQACLSGYEWLCKLAAMPAAVGMKLPGSN